MYLVLDKFNIKSYWPSVMIIRLSSRIKIILLTNLFPQFQAETEKNKLNATLTRLKEDSLADILNFYKARSPKKPTDITTKLQMKKMVEDLENEIGK